MTGYYLVNDRDSGERWDDDTGDAFYVTADRDWDSVRESMPPHLADSSDWIETYAAGYSLEDAVRWVLGPEGELLTDGEVMSIVDSAVAYMSPDQAEDFFGSIGKAFKSALPVIGQVAQTVLPIAGGAIGTVVAPGIGTALGGALGQAAGGLVGQATAQAPTAARAVRQVVRRAVPRAVTQAAGQLGAAAQGAYAGAAPHLAAAAQGAAAAAAPAILGPTAGGAINRLMSLINDPQILGAVANAAMGGVGNAPAGGAAFGQLMGALSQTATEAAAEVHGFYAGESLAAECVNPADHARTLVRIIGEAAGGGARS